MTVTFILNGEDVSARFRSGERLVDVLREDFGLLSLKADCRNGSCGKCLVLMDGKLVPSCQVPAFRARGKEIITFEGYSQTEEHADIRAALAVTGLETCGFCEAGVNLAIASLLEIKPRPDRAGMLEHLSAVRCSCHDPETLLETVLAADEVRARRLYHRGRQ